MYSTPLKNNNFENTRAQIGLDGDQLEITGNCVVITPPADTIATFDPLASKMAPLAKFEGSTNVAQLSVGHYWKTFDEDGVISRGSGPDDSSSESSDDENFSENFIGHKKIIPAEEQNGWVATENTPNGNVKYDGNRHAAGLGTSTYPDQQNGLVHDDLKTLHSGNNNYQGSNVASTDTRTAIQTDF